MPPSARSRCRRDARARRRRDVGRRRLGRGAAARARRRRRGRRHHAAALDRRAGARRRARLLLARGRRCARARAATRSGIPHVTLDGREAFRRAVVEPFVAGYARGETPNPCTTCNGSYRLAALVDAAARLGAGHVATGHYARLVERDGRDARRARRRRGQGSVLHARARARRACSRGCGSRSATPPRPPCAPRPPRPAWPRRPRARARTSASSAAARSTTSSRAQGVQLAAGSIRDEAGQRARPPRRRRRVHAGAAPRPRRSRPPRRSTCCAPTPARNELVVGPRSSLACSDVLLREARLDERRRAACTPSCARARPRSPRASSRRPEACACCSTSPSTAWPPGRPRCSTTTPDAWSDRA